MSFFKTKLPIESVMSVAASGLVQQFTLPNGTAIKLTPNVKMLALKGCKCDVCGVEGDHFKIRKNNKQNKGLATMTLFNTNGTTMTIDHHIPKCMGGKDKQHNYIPLCNKCNQNWKSQFDLMEKDAMEGVFRLSLNDIVKETV